MSDLAKQVRVALEEMVGAGTENGLQAAVYHRGELVVAAVAGIADPATGVPVTPDGVFFAASTAKGVAATAVRHALTHSAGVPLETLNRT